MTPWSRIKLALCLALLAAASIVRGQTCRPEPAPSGWKPIHRGQRQRYSFHLAAGAFARYQVRQRNIDIGSRLRAPDGTVQVEFDPSSFGAEEVAAITKTSGCFVLEVLASKTTRPRASIGSNPLRSAWRRPKDAKVIEAQTLFARGRLGMERSTAEGSAEAARAFEQAARLHGIAGGSANRQSRKRPQLEQQYFRRRFADEGSGREYDGGSRSLWMGPAADLREGRRLLSTVPVRSATRHTSTARGKQHSAAYEDSIRSSPLVQPTQNRV